MTSSVAAVVRSSGPSFALALGGGGARGFAHIHVIEVLDELGIRPTAIAGSSIGAIMGAGMAAGMTGKDIHAYARLVLSRRSEVATRMWRARPGSIGEMVEGGLRIGQFNIERILKAFLPAEIPADFADLGIPLKVTATDFYGHGPAVLESGDLYSALAASAAIPAIFRPVNRDGRLYIDGGVYNPVPFDLIGEAADIVIAIDVVGTPVQSKKRVTSVELVFGASQLMMKSIIAMKLKHSRPAIFLRPPRSRVRLLDFLKVDSALAETVGLKDELKRAIDEAVNAGERVRRIG
jgi:NTE family protein